MSKFIKKMFALIMIVSLFIFSSIPFVSAAPLLDGSKTVSFTLNCTKPGYEFTVYQVASLDSTSTTPYETKYNPLVSGIDNSILNGDTAALLAALDNVSDSDLEGLDQGTFTTSGTSTTKTVSDVEQGVYYIKATNYPAGVKAVTNSVAALPYYNSGWVYTIPAINLAEKVVDYTPETHKEITNSTKGNVNFTDVSLGDTVEFEIRSTTTGSKAMKLGSYAVYDNMSKGLTLNKDSFNIALLTKEGTKITDLDKSEYTVTVTKEKEGENTEFNVALTKDYLQTDELYEANVYYTSVTYSAVLNKYAVVGKEGNPNDELKLEYSNKHGVTDEVEANTVYVYTYAVMTDKYNEAGKSLAGAKFSLYSTKENAETQQNEIATGTSDEIGKVLYYNSNGEEIRLQSGTYYIVETEAPSGYNLYGKVIEITIDAEYGSTIIDGTYVTNSPENGYASVDVKDTKVVLPKTGRNGNNIFYIVGAAILVSSALVIFLTAKCKSKKTK